MPAILKVANVYFDTSGDNRLMYLGDKIPRFVSNGAIRVPLGTTAERSANVSGTIRYNTDINRFEGRDNDSWITFSDTEDANVAFTKANSAYDLANSAFLAANVALETANIQLSDTTSNSTHYIMFTPNTSNGIGVVNVSSGKLIFNPNTGTLSATTFSSLSDETKKKEIEVIENALDLLETLKGVRYKWIDTGNPSAGILAQDLQEIMPELVDHDMSVNYSGVVALLVEAVKELNTRLKQLES